MKKILKKNQVVITVLTMLVAIAGYLNYSWKADQILRLDSKEEAAVSPNDISDEDILEENRQLQQAEAGEYIDIYSLDGDGTDEEAKNEDGSKEVNSPGEAILTNGVSVADFLAQAKLSREQTRGQNQETLLEIINNETLDAAAKQAAVNQMVELTETAELENAVETLLQAKGFESVIVSILDDSVDVVVCRNSISDSERAQIEDIVKRKTQLSAEHIVITLMELQNK